jgi:hypothetical protein
MRGMARFRSRSRAIHTLANSSNPFHVFDNSR